MSPDRDRLKTSVGPPGSEGEGGTSGPVTVVAEGAVQSATPHLQDRLAPLVEARLAEVVQRLRSAWLAGPALLWDDVRSVDELTGTDLEKRVARLLGQGFFQFSQFLAGFEVLLLQLHQLRVVREETVLGLEKLIVDLGDSTGSLVVIAECQRRLADVLCGLERGDRRAD